MRVLLFGTCLVDSYFPEVGEDTVRLLRRFGATVMYPKEQTCCGQPAYNAGYRGEAKDAAESAAVRVFERSQFLVRVLCAHEYHPRHRPQRTADVERTLAIGVHGPERLDVIVIGSALEQMDL